MIEEALKAIGISEKTAKIYLALLEMGQGTVSHISEKTRFPRSTVYSLIPELVERKLIFPFEQGKVMRFAPQDPKKLFADIQTRALLVKEALPELRALYQAATTKPGIIYYTGREELERMYNEILTRRDLKEYDIIASEEKWRAMNPRFFDNFKKRRAAAGIHTRLILEYSETALMRKETEEETHSEVKILPPAFSLPFSAGCYIFSDEIIFVAYRKEHVAVKIISREIASLMHMVFTFIWRQLSREITSVIKENR